MKKIKKNTLPKIGIYSMGLQTYWNQFEGLKERLLEYGNFISNKINTLNADCYYYGMVDCPEEGKKAGEYFTANNVDIIFAHCATYVTSTSILPLHQICKAPVILLNLQAAPALNYDVTTTGEWLSQCGACPVPEISNAFIRSGIKYNIINGLLGLDYTPASSMTDEVSNTRPEAIKAWNEIEEWVKAATVKANINNCCFGFLGNYYSGMLDMYTDFTVFQSETGAQIKILEMCDLAKQMSKLSPEEIKRAKNDITDMFTLGDSGSDPRNRKVTEYELEYTATVAAALKKLVEEYNLDALTYYYHSTPGADYEALQTGMIPGLSLLTAQGIPCAGEADIKTCLAMKICDILNIGGSFCEIVCTDYNTNTILMGHDGPFHLAIAEGKPILRSLGVYHGKVGGGVSVEAKVKRGPITNLGCSQRADGHLKFTITEALSTDNPIMKIGNTQTPVKFNATPDNYMDEWFKEAPTHHFAMSIGHNSSIFSKAFKLLNIDYVVLDR